MDMQTLGRTGLTISAFGLGCGGHSRLGMARGASNEEAAKVVKAALDLGVNHIDTARMYGTETAVGIAIQGHDRDKLIIASKVIPYMPEGIRLPSNIKKMLDMVAPAPPGPVSREYLRAETEASLRALKTDYLDILYLHGAGMRVFDHCMGPMLDELRALQARGLIRHLAVSEEFYSDTRHEALRAFAQLDPCPWDVMMAGINFLNPSARKRLLPLTMEKNIGVTGMFAVRRDLVSPENLREVLPGLVESGALPQEALETRWLEAIVNHPDIASLAQAAYRFVRHEPGIDCVLAGTGSLDHLRVNIDSVNAPPLPQEIRDALEQLFGDAGQATGG